MVRCAGTSALGRSHFTECTDWSARDGEKMRNAMRDYETIPVLPAPEYS